MSKLEERLKIFEVSNEIRGKGPLSVVLVVTRLASKMGFPVDTNELLTDGGGQVKGLGRSPVQAILNEHGIQRVLSEEGGRTSRGSINNMRAYVAFLNSLNTEGLADFGLIEKWWIERIKGFFASKPFRFKIDPSKSIRSAVRELTEQAFKRQKDLRGTMFAGAVFQHLVGAKLQLILPQGAVNHNGFSVADSPTNRAGDFLLDDVCIHVTTAPGESLVRKCEKNLSNGLHPLIITTKQGADVVDGLAKNAGIDGRIDIFEIEQFIASNIYEISKFMREKRKVTVDQLIEKYNAIVEKCETDPSLKIEVD